MNLLRRVPGLCPGFCTGGVHRLGPQPCQLNNLEDHDLCLLRYAPSAIQFKHWMRSCCRSCCVQVVVWDVRQSPAVWKGMVAEGAAICAVHYLPGGRHGVVAATDGTLRLIDLHHCGSVAAAMNCGKSLVSHLRACDVREKYCCS